MAKNKLKNRAFKLFEQNPPWKPQGKILSMQGTGGDGLFCNI